MKPAFLCALALALPLGAAPLPVKPYGQELVDRVLAKERDVLILVMHASTPGAANHPIIASNIGRIGKEADEDDLRVINTGKANLEVAHSGTRFEVELPMHDLAGHVIGALGVVFPYREGADKAALEKRAIAIRDWLARRTLDAGALVEPHPYEARATTVTHAQKLVEETVAAHPDIDLAAVLARSPKGGQEVIVASTFGKIGARAGAARVASAAASGRVEIDIALLDAKGNAVGTLVLGWAGGGKETQSRAEKIRDSLRLRISSLESLFELDP